MDPILNYYTQQSPISDPGPYAHLYDPLPDAPGELCAVVQGLILHRLMLDYYHIDASPEQRAEWRLHTIRQRLERLQAVDNAPLAQPRPPAQRQVGVCRDFALLLVSMLRHKGIPARMRVGFAKYLDPGGPFYIDHWITEYWDAGRGEWILTDAEIDPIFKEALEILTDTTELERGRDFFLAGSAWELARAGQVRSDLFRFNGHWKGLPCIRGNLLHDFDSLNKLEPGVLDSDDLIHKSESSLSVEDKALLDRLARLTLAPDENFTELSELFEALPRTRQIGSRLRLAGIDLGEEYQAANPAQANGLQLSDAERLAGEPSPAPPRPRLRYVPYDIPPDSTLYAATWDGIGDIWVRGARQHNLKHIDVRIPRHKLVVVTGVSGSGKSSLAFDTIYAEGQRRYVESLSSYARQFMEQMEKPQVDQITGLSPAIAIEQKTVSRNPRSTVGTVTEVQDYLRVLYARIGVPHCPQCGRAVTPQSAQQIADQLARLPGGTRFHLLAPILRNRKGEFKSTLAQALKDGYTRACIDGQMFDLQAGLPALDKHARHNIELVVDRVVVPPFSPAGSALPGEGEQSLGAPLAPSERGEGARSDFDKQLSDSVETTLRAGKGTLIVQFVGRDGQPGETLTLSEHNACPVCDLSFPELEPNLFSFNSPLGMCDECNGLGVKLQVDPGLIIAHPERSLLDGASPWWGDIKKKGESNWSLKNLSAIAEHYGVDLRQPWNELPESFRQVLLYGSDGERIKFAFEMESDRGEWRGESLQEVKGAVYNINRLFRQTHSEYTRRFYMSFMSQLPCPKCQGERLNPQARFVTVGGKRLAELSQYSIEALYEWISRLPEQLNAEQRQIGGEMVEEIRQRLRFIRNVGLHYLTLDRPAPTLSGGEGQRIRLASQIGSGLVGVLYILDEPSIGLHTRDHRALLDTLTQLRDQGNTVLVVEHDAETMRTADWLIDLGPGPGVLGGELIAAGTPQEVMANPNSLTGRYLSGQVQVHGPDGGTRRAPHSWLTIHGARLHNLKNLEARFPLGALTCVTGVSGSGKSSLIAHTLYPALSRLLHKAQAVPGPYDAITGLEQIDKVVNITQEPIGRNPRSNPGTYAGVLPEIRAVFASTPEARALGYGASRFSFNVKGGRCEACAGYGYKKVEMHFLADVWVTCKECNGQRFNRATLDILYKGKNIAEVLDMDVQQALEFFAPYPGIARILQTLHDVGLDYIKLGQSALTLSGGEAQRVKLAKELSAIATGRTVYILDEPTTGLHFADIQRLLDVLHRLVDAGNTVIVVEHNLDIIKTADWIVDLGPEGGQTGGSIVAAGPPEAIAACPASHTGRYLKEIF